MGMAMAEINLSNNSRLLERIERPVDGHSINTLTPGFSPDGIDPDRNCLMLQTAQNRQPRSGRSQSRFP